jgi:hypothetical protein
MENLCPKCGTPKSLSDEQCSNCGVIYAKLGDTPFGRVTASKNPPPRLLYWGLAVLFILLVIAVVFPGLHATPGTSHKTENSAVITQTTGDAASAEDKAAEAKRIESARIAGHIMAQYQQWKDSVAVAKNINRNGLSDTVANLQAIRRDTASIDVPTCLVPAKQSLLDSMNQEIDGFLMLLHDNGTATDAAASPFFNDAQNAADVYEKRIHECLPDTTA